MTAERLRFSPHPQDVGRSGAFYLYLRCHIGSDASSGLGAVRGRSRPHARALSDKVEAIKIHDLVPGSHKVMHELLLRVVTRVDLRDGPELGVRAEDEVDGGGGPFELARGAVATLVQVFSRRGWRPRRAHVEQVH